MKTRFLAPALLLGAVLSSQPLAAQPGGNSAAPPLSATNLPPDTDYSPVSLGPNHRVMQRTTYETNASGKVVLHVHRYTELATGMNHLVGNQLVPSSDQITITATGAQATNAQYQVTFLGDIAGGGVNGAIQLTTPDDKHLRSNVLGLGYFDTSSERSVMFAELTNSIGSVLPSGNEALYPDAFTDIHADVLYVVSLAGLEQFIVLKGNLPSPAEWGLDPSSTMLQVLSEFLGSETPGITQVETEVGPDQFLDFGVFQMAEGDAFALGSETNKIPVTKQWLVMDGRSVLVESVPLKSLAPLLQDLPPFGSAGLQSPSGSARHQASIRRELPPRKLARKDAASLKVASARPRSKGVALDYNIVAGVSNQVFQTDATYFVNSVVYLVGSNVFEGGTVIKYATNASLYVRPSTSTPTAIFLGSPYRPIICTCQDDNTCGSVISGSSGTPSGYYANPALLFYAVNSPSLSHARFSYAQKGLQYTSCSGISSVSDAQFIGCNQAIHPGTTVTLALENDLFINNASNIVAGIDITNTAENCTFSGSALLGTATGSASLALTNCILVNITNLVDSGFSLTGAYNGFYQTAPFGINTLTNSVYPFQTAAAGGYYLAANSPFRNAGTTNVDSALLADLATKTTFPPIVFSNSTFMANTTLGPQAQRDSGNGNVDLGYHYDCLDYAFYSVVVSNSVLTLNPGTAVAMLYGQYHAGLFLHDSSQFVSQGTPNSPNWITAYNMVQEQPGSGVATLYEGLVSDQYSPGAGSVTARFTDWSGPAQDAWMIYCLSVPVNVRDCEFHGGWLDIESSFAFTNCFFDRVYSYLAQSATNPVTVCNSLFHDGTFEETSLLTNAIFRDNFFELSSNILDDSGWTYTGGHNAYVTNFVGQMNKLGSDLVLTNTLAWQAGPLGNFYQPSNSPLINAGSTTADQVSLYHYTVMTNIVSGLEIKEGMNIVSIGYHYVTVDTNGVPIDTNGDGVPDYLEDANGNGLVDSGEVGWNLVGDLGLNVLITRPKNNSVIP